VSSDALDHAWLYDLVDPDDQVRGRALARQRAHVAAPFWPEAERSRHETQSFGGPIAAFLHPFYLVPDMTFAPFALLYLRWEARYPDDWRAPESNLYSPWSIKEQVLRRFATSGVPDALRPEAADLVLAAIQRPYRCKDWRYARLIGRVDSPAFRDRVNALAHGPLLAARARFVLHVAEHPGQPVNRNSWRRWVADETA
jgi:hypothetical protein